MNSKIRIPVPILFALSLGAIMAAACGSYSSPPTGGTGAESGGVAGSQQSGSGGYTGVSGNTSGGTVASSGGAEQMGSGGSSGAGTAAAGSANGGTMQSSGGSGPLARGGNAGSAAGGALTGGMGQSGGAGATGSGGVMTGSGGNSAIPLPCDVLKSGGNTCVAAHSTVRVIVPGYAGPLYQLCKGMASAGPNSCKGSAQDVASKDGYADTAAHDAFCSGEACTITKIYDQSGQNNHLEPAPKGGAKGTPDNPAAASALKLTVNGHAAYGILIKAGIGYRTGCSGCSVKSGNGMVKGDTPETMYWVTSQKDLIDGCCFDYGNAETTSNDDGNGTMETLYFGGGVVWGTGYGGKPGPWMMADLENGLYAGWENKQDKNISTNKPLKYDFVTGVLLGDTRDKNGGKGRFALYGGDATNGALQTMYDGIRPEKPGYVPMQKQGSIILGIGGDNSNSAGGRFYEGAIAVGPVASKQSVDALQAAIVAVNYGK